MARLSMNKASLTKQKRQLKVFAEILPSLDLKRRQLTAERNKARELFAQTQTQLADLESALKHELPMLSNDLVDLTDLVQVVGVDLAEQNLLGTRLPKLNQVQIRVRDYGLLNKPIWVDRAVKFLKAALEFQIAIQVAQQQVVLLNQAERTVTQRFNLFDKVLIPRTKANIKKIEIYLSDAERAMVVNSKLAKQKEQQRA
jgi:V/A-type H+/Na+-transporting ATPase subunit D